MQRIKEWIQKNKKTAVILAILLLLAAVLLGRFLLTRGEVTSYQPEFEEGQEQTVSEGGVEAGIKIPGYSTITVDAGTKDVAVELSNPEENQVYFQITFLLGEEQEQIYQSKLIKPGDHLYEITLDRALDPGTYDLTIQYDTFSMDDSYTPRNGASVNSILEAK